jgi:hypothetical protein
MHTSIKYREFAEECDRLAKQALTERHLPAEGRRLRPTVLVLVLGLDLLLLLDYGPCFLGCFWAANHHFGVPVIVRQPQPDLRHVGEGTPRFSVSKRARHL